MLLSTLLTVLSLLIAPSTLAQPIETPSPTVAKRAYSSGSYTCYYTCPSIPEIQVISPMVLDEPLGSRSLGGDDSICQYTSHRTTTGGSFIQTCYYHTSTGVYFGGSGYIRSCPAQLACATSDSGPTTNQFKRDLVKRELSPSALAIQSRQYRPDYKKVERDLDGSEQEGEVENEGEGNDPRIEE